MYSTAVAHGGTGLRLDRDEERALSWAELLAMASDRVTGTARAALSLEVLADGAPHNDGVEETRNQAQQLRAAAAAQLRLTHRALEAHARELGYSPQVYVDRVADAAKSAVDEARGVVDDTCPAPMLSDLVDEAHAHASRALLCMTADRCAVPGKLADTLGCWFLLFLIGELLVKVPAA
jgi:hypothetical protein